MALSPRETRAVQVIDNLSPLNAQRGRRPATTFIILHTTEGPDKGSLNKVWENGEANYFVDTAGRIYRVIDRQRIAYHTGRSVWNGVYDLDSRALGIEISGYHNQAITPRQYVAVRDLVDGLQRVYRVPDERVMPHAMVAYGTPNAWHSRAHRGRKRCGMLFARPDVRQRLGLAPGPAVDPDVKAGRLVNGDPYLAAVMFGSAPARQAAMARFSASDANVVSQTRSAWDIARDMYDDAATTYIFPDGTKKAGNRIANWKAIPLGTKVVVAGEGGAGRDDGAAQIGRQGRSARELAGAEYASASTIYILPDGRAKRGSDMAAAELAGLPAGTRVLTGYVLGGSVTAKRSAFDICGVKWNNPSTLYRFPDGTLVAGDRLKEGAIPKNTTVFYRN